ncbi:MAG TPA: tRNA lysidine(34) synthetase TilS, partial [Gammaproteobacteria bacterium]|nr:tRNA lysidine(34) synthetase TilS [Gammaproteobacteria bacterium]
MKTAIQQFITKYGQDKTYWVAYSGGLDSHVLLDLCVALQKEYYFNLKVIHVHHGISPNANEWLKHCQRACVEYQVELISEHVKAIPPEGVSLEEYARDLRYAVFKQRVEEKDIVLTAQHQDDQAETFLIQLIRGAGPKGLSGMPAIKPLGKGWLGRPLLNFSRLELAIY